MIERANQWIQSNKVFVNPQFKPLYHFSAKTGWLNDPNGFVFFKGEYHLFYQYNPYDSSWATMHWGHAKSKDLINWEYLPVALAPDKPYDKDGCFSGSAIVKDDVLWLMYTGHIVNEDGSVTQVQNMAYSKDGIHFEKSKQNPVATGDILPEGILFEDFRDPKLFEKNGRYYAVVATKHRDGVGCVVLLGSDDLIDWVFESIFLKGKEKQGEIWECPDYFELDGVSYLVVSPMKYQKDKLDYVNLNANILIEGEVDWTSKTFIAKTIKEIDHGHDFYAAQTLETNDKQRVMIAWMHTWGRPLIPHELKHGWFGNMTLPRVLTLKNGKVYQTLPNEVLQTLPKLDLPTSSPIGYFDREVTGNVHYRLGNEKDYICFGYDASLQEVYIDRTHVSFDMTGEEAWPTQKRAVKVVAKHLSVVVDKNSVEVFVNDGEETLTSTYYIDGKCQLVTLQ